MREARLRLVLVLAAPFPSPQGSQVYVEGMARALRDRGHDVVVVAYGYGVGETDVPVVGVPVPEGYRRMRAGPDARKPLLDLRLVTTLRRVGGDVLLAHNYEALVASLTDGRPVVYFAHNLLAEELPTYFSAGRPALRIAGALADRLLPRRADAVVALTTAAAARLPGASVIPPGVHPEEFSGVVPRRLHPEPTVVYAGNPDAYQDLDLLRGAMSRLPGIRLVIVTATPFEFPGATIVVTSSWPQTRAIVAGADAMAIPRSLVGGFPLKLLNALALGVPAVVTAPMAQGLRGEFVAPAGDPEGFAAAIRVALLAPADRGALSAATLARCAWSARGAELDALLRTLPRYTRRRWSLP